MFAVADGRHQMRAARDLEDARSGPGSLDCRALAGLATAYLDGALPPADRDRADRHLLGCADCLRYLGQLCLTIDELRRLGPDSSR